MLSRSATLTLEVRDSRSCGSAMTELLVSRIVVGRRLEELEREELEELVLNLGI